ncbi:SZT2 protein, partial [Polypterus senegalus]
MLAAHPEAVWVSPVLFPPALPGVAEVLGSRVLVQGCQLDKVNLDDFLDHIYQQLRTEENNIAEILQQQHKARELYNTSTVCCGVPNEVSEDQHQRKIGVSMITADIGLVSMVRQGILALQLLPPNSSAVSQHKLFNEHLVSASGNPALAMRRKKHTEKEVHAHLISVVSVRLREGYTIRDISLIKGGTQLEVKLVLLWKHNMRIEYVAIAHWPLDPSKRTTWVEVTMEGSYDILHDIIPKHLHTPGNNGHYSTIQCRISHSALTSLLRDWSSFVLVEGYSYIKLIYRIRVSEGFHFAASGDGIVNMVTELPMKCVSQNGDGEIHTCIVQYVLFPPHSTSSKDSFSTDDDNDTEVEAIEVDTELNLVTECWVEPQSGLVFSSLNSHSHLQGLSYQEIPKAIFPYDLTCISTILTFEYLSQLCQNKDHISPIAGIKEEGEEYDISQDLSALPNELLLSLFHGSLQQDLNDREIPLADADHIAFMQQVLQRDRDGHIAPFILPAVNEECLNSVKSLERQDTVMSFRTVGSNKEVTGSTSTLQSFGNAEMADEDFAQPHGEMYFPRWKCYAKYVNAQQIFLTFLPASFADILSLASTGPDRKKQHEMDELLEENCNRQNQNRNNFHEQLNETLLTEEQKIIGVANGTEKANGIEESASFVSLPSLNNDKDNGRMKNENGTTVKVGNSKESIQFAEPQKRDIHITFSRQGSQLEGNDQNKPRCPVYIYNCSLDLLREQLVNPRVEKHRDIYFRSMYQERSTSTSWTDLLAHSHKYKVLTNYCSLLQEHYHQSYVKGVYRSLQQSYHISSQDVLTAMDYCEESLKEIEITTFLQTLCGHIKNFKESFDHPVVSLDEIPPITKTTFTVGVNEPDEEGSDRGPLVSTSSIETEDVSEAESRGRLSNPASPLISEVQETHRRYPEFPLSLLHTNQKCELYPDLHQIIQEGVDRGEVHRRPSDEMEVSEAELATEDENVSGCCIVTESDTDLEVEYLERLDRELPGNSSLSDSNTVNQDEDSFSILEGDSFLEPEEPQQELPPLFVHLTCSINVKNCHGSMPMQTLPTCLGEVITCLENAESIQSVDLKDLSVTLDIFVLTLPLEIEMISADPHHKRYTSESSVSLNRSPAQPSSYLSDEELMQNMDRLPSEGEDRVIGGDPFSKLPIPHKQAVLATMDEIRWVLEDEIVSATRHLRVINKLVLQKVADHVYNSQERENCRFEVIPLQFVFGPDQSLAKFKEVSATEKTTTSEFSSVVTESLDCGNISQPESKSVISKDDKYEKTDLHNTTASSQLNTFLDQEWNEECLKSEINQSTPGLLHLSSNSEKEVTCTPPPKTPSATSLADSVHSAAHFSGKLRPSRVQSVVSSQGSLDSDMLGYDGGSSDSECEGTTMNEQDQHCPLMPNFWLIVKIHQDRVEVYSHCRSPKIARVDVLNVIDEGAKEEDEVPEYLQLHQMIVKRIGEICRIVNQTLLLQDLHDSHICNSLLVAESEEDIWKTDLQYTSYRQRSAATDAIQALRSVLNAFSVVNRKNMFVYQERATKSVFYLRLSETAHNGKFSEYDGTLLQPVRSLGLIRSQEPIASEDVLGSRSSLDVISYRGVEGSRPVGQMDKHILLMVHGVGQAGPEITDELVKVLRKRLDEATLDIITVMLVRNCKLTPADVEFIQPPGSQATEVIEFSLPQYSQHWLHAFGYYLRQNLLIFLHVPKYTDSNVEHHFKHTFYQNCGQSDSDLYLYNKPGGQGTGGKGPWVHVRFDIWEQGNVSPVQLADKLKNALRHALCDVIMEFKVLSNPLCVESTLTASDQKEYSAGLPAQLFCDVKDLPKQLSNSGSTKRCPSPILFSTAPPPTSAGAVTPESTTPTGKTARRSFWDMLSKPDLSELGSPKTTDDIILEKAEDSRTRRRHKTENVKQPWSQEKVAMSEMEQAQKQAAAQRKHTVHLEEGETGNLHPVFQSTCQKWLAFMDHIGCPSVQQCSAEIVSQFLLPSILTEVVNLVSSLAIDTTVKVFERICSTNGETFLPLSLNQHSSKPPAVARQFILIGRNFQQWRQSTEQAHKGFQRFESLEQSESGSSAVSGKGTVPRQRFTIVDVLDKKEPNHFLSTTLEADALLRSATPPPTKDQGKLSGSGRSLPPLHFSTELVSFDEALRDIAVGWPIMAIQDISGNADPVFRHGAQLLEIKAVERREMEKQLKIENLFVTWQQRSAQSNMPISAADLDTLKQSSRLVHYCATPLLFDPVFRKQIQEDQTINPFAKKRHCSNDSTASGRDRTNSCDSVEMLPCRLKDEPWLLDISNTFVQQYVQYLQSMGFILVQVRPPSPARSIARARAAAFCGMNTDSRSSFSYNKQKSEESPKGSYFCVKQYALECSRIPMGQSVNSQLSMLFTEECDKVRDLMHVHSFSYDFHLRIVHQYLLGCQMTLRQGYQLSSFLEDFIAYHPDIPKFGRNHVFQGTFSISTGMITAHQLYNYITDHAVTYGMKPLRMSKSTESSNSRKGVPNSELPEYALVALWNSSGSYKDSEGLRHHDDFDVSLLVCHACAPFEEQSEVERNLLRLTYYVIMTSQRELFPRLTADMRRFKKLPNIQREPLDPDSKSCRERSEAVVVQDEELDLWEKLEDYSSEFYSSRPQVKMAPGLIYSSPQFPLLASEVTSAQERILSSVQKAKEHCRRDNLWRRLFHGEQLSSDKLKLSKLTFTELEELLNAVQSCVIGDIDPQLDCFLTMNPGWYQSLIKVLLSRFAQSCRHFVDNDNGIQYLVVLNQKFTDCFVIVFLDSQTGKAVSDSLLAGNRNAPEAYTWLFPKVKMAVHHQWERHGSARRLDKANRLWRPCAPDI